MRVLNKYTDEFRRNVVSVLRSGMKVYDVARRLDVPISTIWSWLHEEQFAFVGLAILVVLALFLLIFPQYLPTRLISLPEAIKNPLVPNPTTILSARRVLNSC